VLVASDGVGAIKQLLDFPVSYIITDYRMENLGGDYWMRFLQRYCGDMKVLVTSGFLKADLPIPYQFLAKPYSFKELEERLRAL
jgi:DNA-binding response OmpR family regulator